MTAPVQLVPATGTGVRRWVVVPSPSWPSKLGHQQKALPSVDTPEVAVALRGSKPSYRITVERISRATPVQASGRHSRHWSRSSECSWWGVADRDPPGDYFPVR
ncbi:MAG: hypothetical protein H0V43_05485 [Gemmatimonadales bacterium]|nr:hypothetical protein [Gemmatimonadales bacterium]